MKRLGDPAILTQKVSRLESRFNANEELGVEILAEDAVDHQFTHSELAQLLRIGLRAKKRLGALVIPAIRRVARLGQRDQRLQRLAPVLIHGRKCTMRADLPFNSCRAQRGIYGGTDEEWQFTGDPSPSSRLGIDYKRPMPLPKSILCSSCRKTYPEGWRRCPYCGHDELRLKQEGLARKFMQKKVQEFEQKVGRQRPERRAGGKPPRPETRGQERRPQQQQAGAQQAERPGRGRRRRRRGARPHAQTSGAPTPPPARSAPQSNPPRPEGGGGGRRRRFRRRRRGGGDGSGGPPPPKSP